MKILHIITTLEMGVSETIISFVGYMGPDKVAQQVKNTRFFLTSSFTEVTHAAILETMTFGPAVMISKSYVYDEPGKNGYVNERFQAEYYVERIRYLLDNVRLLLEIFRRNTERAISYRRLEVSRHFTE